MHEDQIRQEVNHPTMVDFKRLEAERDHLRHLLKAGQRKAVQGEIDLAGAHGREIDNQIELRQQSVDLKEATDTIDRQADSLAGQSASIVRLEGERDASTTRADGLQIDVNERTLALREQELLLACVLDSSVDGVLVYRSVSAENGCVVDFECVLNNPAAERLFGLASLTGKRLLDLHPDIHQVGLWNGYLSVMETGAPFEGEYRYAQAGEARWFRVLAIKVANGLAITFFDISQRKQMEADILRQLEELKQADRMKNEFLGVISHELRTPLNGIMGFISVLEDGLAGPMPQVQQAYLGKATQSAERLLGLVDNLLDMSRIQAGRFSVDARPAQFATILKGVLAKMAAATPPRTVISQVQAGLPIVLADEARVAQVLDILIGNAFKFSADAGTITVRASAEAGFLRCEVEDAGIGIAHGDLSKLFAIFSQVDMSSTRLQGGAGLSLALAKSLVEAHGGLSGVDSQEGRGSTFWFTLPLAAPSRTAGPLREAKAIKHDRSGPSLKGPRRPNPSPATKTT